MYEDGSDGYGRRVSIMSVPRQRWSLAERSLAAIIRTMPTGTQLIYVDGGSPPRISRQLEQLVRDAGGIWIRRDCALAANEARNLGVAHADREFVISVDNDVVPHEHWVERLVDCADETGAGVVGPNILEGPEESSRLVHTAGGRFEIHDGAVQINEHYHQHQPLDSIDDMVRRPSSQLEFHALLMRRTLLDAMGPFDERVRSIADHEDVVLGAARLGFECWFEPSSVVLFMNKIPLDDDEIGFWQLRWSEAFNNDGLDRFAEKWEIDPHSGWTEEARWWSAAERTRWMHGRSSLHSYAGRAFRKAFWTPGISRPARRFEQRFVSRRFRHEVQRRRAVLGHD